VRLAPRRAAARAAAKNMKMNAELLEENDNSEAEHMMLIAFITKLARKMANTDFCG